MKENLTHCWEKGLDKGGRTVMKTMLLGKPAKVESGEQQLPADMVHRL